MINSIIDSIAIALHAEFGNAYRIYTENVEQGLKEPCFFIQCIHSSSEQTLDRRYHRRHQLCITYFPETKDEERKEIQKVIDRLYLCLEYVAMDGWIRGIGMHTEIVDDVLSFFVNYDYFVHRIEEMNPMQGVSHNTNIRGDV